MKNYFLFMALMVAAIEGKSQSKYDTFPIMHEHYAARYTLFQNQKMTQGGVIMLGNSITEQGDWQSLFHDSTVLNRGISGDVTFGVLHRLREVIKRQPAKLFLLIGVNDLSRNTPDEIIQHNIFEIVNKIHIGSPVTIIYVQSILPIDESFQNLNKNFLGKAAHITAINKQLKLKAVKYNYRFIDLYSRFLNAQKQPDARWYYTDGLHLNSAGYQHWADVLKEGKYW